MIDGGYEHLVILPSVSMADGGHAAASLYNQLWRASQPARIPRVPALPAAAGGAQGRPARRPAAPVPPLIRAASGRRLDLRRTGVGSDFNTAGDLPVLLPMNRLDARYARHFMGKGLNTRLNTTPRPSSPAPCASFCTCCGRRHVALVYPRIGDLRRLTAEAALVAAVALTSSVSGSTRRSPASRRAALIVANYISWLDIYVLNAARPMAFVSKSGSATGH